MSQQLIIQNDEDEDYVQFTVEIPDGYAGFNISSINGTMINQNYLNIGDVIRFKFSNNPIRYADSPSIQLTRYTTETRKQDIDYSFCDANLFNIYRVKYVPIYAYYGVSKFDSCLIFNPADEDNFFDEPINALPDYNISANISAPFTGQYVITLDKVDKIPDIDIVIGESINNSKTQPESLTFNESGEQLPTNQIGSTYDYATSWRYNVSNLLMNHKLTITKDSRGIIDIAYFVYSADDKCKYTTPKFPFNNVWMSAVSRTNDPESPIFYIKQWDDESNPPRFISLQDKCIINQDDTLKRNMLIKDGDDYAAIPYDPYAILDNTLYDFIPNGLKINGSQLDPSKYVMYSFNDDETDINIANDYDFHPFVDESYFYTGNKRTIAAYRTNGRLIKSTRIKFTTYQDHHYQLIRPNYKDTYHVIELDYNDHEIGEYDIKFREYNKTNSFVVYVLGEIIQLDENGLYTFIESVNTGYASAWNASSADLTNNQLAEYPLQLTTTECEPADDDIIIKHVIDDGRHGLEISMADLTNYRYIVSDVSATQMNVRRVMMNGSGGAMPLVFIPKKSNIIFQPFDIDDVITTAGMMKVLDIYGSSITNIDEKCGFFIADGHESLNVKTPATDDYKFKTFNANITFDRSQSKIVRLFSMSNSNSCIGYINDILSARLSRYYFASNYSIFNTFFNDKGQTYFANTLNQAQSIYSSFNESMFTGLHDILLSNMGDTVKLIGSDTITNNCFPNICPEEHQAVLSVVNNYNVMTKNDILMNNYYYKIFHYYDSGLDQFPSIGGDSRLTKGISFMKINPVLFNQEIYHYNSSGIKTRFQIYVSNQVRATNQLQSTTPMIALNGYSNMTTNIGLSNEYISIGAEIEREIEKGGGFITVLPVPRVYRNANFEQPDLSISTGRIKTLSPIYIQSVNRILLNNIMYMFDMMFNLIKDKYNNLSNNGYYDYLQVFNKNLDEFDVGESATLKRFGSTYVEDNVCYLPLSFDSCWLMNYLCSSSVNEYADSNELSASLPTNGNNTNNEELIEDIMTYRPETNIQLFSSRYFNFHENISALSVVLWVQAINSNLSLLNSDFTQYFGMYDEQNNDDAAYVLSNRYIDNFYSNVLLNNGYNITRTVNMLISKLGEFLDFPKIVFGTTLAFNQSKTVNIQYMNPVNYASEFQSTPKIDEETKTLTGYEENYYPNQKQKNNIAMFGVIFKYHQLSLGWQQMINDIQETFIISRAKGQKHFIVKIYDEFGRQIPNMDTSQGFKNNLRLEINCFN